MKKVRHFLCAILVLVMFLSTVELAEGASGNPEPNNPNKEGNTVANFDRDFLRYIHAQNEKENYVVSPLSFRAALIMAVEGADASTRAQLLSAMGFTSIVTTETQTPLVVFAGQEAR